MFLKVVVIFLLVMMLVGMLGKVFNPDAKPKKRLVRKCPACGSFLIGSGPCTRCTKKKGG
ncbi:MAG: hypothetical protein L3J37_04605 [Rhodobacteraceae bacterium]|nr:hypothetical protein [Paracoccaceae bacterium]